MVGDFLGAILHRFVGKVTPDLVSGGGVGDEVAIQHEQGRVAAYEEHAAGVAARLPEKTDEQFLQQATDKDDDQLRCKENDHELEHSHTSPAAKKAQAEKHDGDMDKTQLEHAQEHLVHLRPTAVDDGAYAEMRDDHRHVGDDERDAWLLGEIDGVNGVKVLLAQKKKHVEDDEIDDNDNALDQFVTH